MWRTVVKFCCFCRSTNPKFPPFLSWKYSSRTKLFHKVSSYVRVLGCYQVAPSGSDEMPIASTFPSYHQPVHQPRRPRMHTRTSFPFRHRPPFPFPPHFFLAVVDELSSSQMPDSHGRNSESPVGISSDDEASTPQKRSRQWAHTLAAVKLSIWVDLMRPNTGGGRSDNTEEKVGCFWADC